MQKDKITKHRQAMRELDEQIRSNRVLTMICTHEEQRILDAILGICQRQDRQWTLFEWDVADGVTARTEFSMPDKVNFDYMKVLRWFANEDDVPSDSKGSYKILVVKDYQKFLKDNDYQGRQVIRLLKNLATRLIGKRKAIIFLGTEMFLPPELEKICAVIDWPLPEYEHIRSQITATLEHAKSMPDIKARFKLSYTETELDQIVRAFMGLTLFEIELLTTKTIIRESCFDPDLIGRKKRDVIRKSGHLDWKDVTKDFSDVGGLEGLKKWLSAREGAFSSEAHDFGLPANPKGVLLIGIQGAGKTLSSEAIAAFYKLPLLKLDMGRIYGPHVGSSEKNIRDAISVAESVAPCLLLLDELDKGMAGSGSSDRTDGGTSSRVLATMLTWMNDKESQVYIVATANEVHKLPAAIMRKGRFDEIFYVGLPQEEERRDIFRIQIAAIKRNPSDFDLTTLAKASPDFTGAEIKAVVESALYEAYSENKRTVTTQDILNAIMVTVPLAKTMEEELKFLQDWASTRAVPASGHKTKGSTENISSDVTEELRNDIGKNNRNLARTEKEKFYDLKDEDTL